MSGPWKGQGDPDAPPHPFEGRAVVMARVQPGNGWGAGRAWSRLHLGAVSARCQTRLSSRTWVSSRFNPGSNYGEFPPCKRCVALLHATEGVES